MTCESIPVPAEWNRYEDELDMNELNETRVFMVTETHQTK